MARNSRLYVRRCTDLSSMFLLFLFQVNQVYTCPSLCQCGEQGSSKYVECSNVNMTDLPDDVPVDTTSLYLSNTQITTLNETYFSALPNLNKILLTNNRIENITDGVFRGLKKLEILNLIDNGIKRISTNALTGLSRLTKLSLSWNELTDLPKTLLADQTNLRTLSLDHNQVKSIPVGFLNNTANLQSLHLNNNKLTSITNELLRKQTSLNMLYLSHNQLVHIEDKSFSAAGNSLMLLNLNSNRLSSYPMALNALNGLFLFGVRLDNNNLITIPQEAKILFDRVKQSKGKIPLSGNPFVCASSLQWLQSWTRDNSVISDIRNVTCTTLDGKTSKLLEYNFDSTEAQNINSTVTMATDATISAQSTSEILLATTTRQTPTTFSVKVTPPTTLLPEVTTSTTDDDTSTSTQQIPAEITKLHGSTSVILPTLPSSSSLSSPSSFISSSPSSPSASSAAAEPSPLLSPSPTLSLSQLPTSSSISSSLLSFSSSSTTNSIVPSPSLLSTSLPCPTNWTDHTVCIPTKPTKKRDKVVTSLTDQKEHIILATCLSAAFIALVVFVAMYCFRKKAIARDKAITSSTRYDRVRVV